MSKKRFILFALVAAIVLSFAGSAFAAEFHWIGGPSSDRKFNTAGNWSPSGIPGASAPNDVYVINGDEGEIIWPNGYQPANPINIHIEGREGSGVTLLLEGRMVLGDATSTFIGVSEIFAESNFTITAARGYEDTDDNYAASKAAYLVIQNITGGANINLRVIDNATIKVDVPFYYTTINSYVAYSAPFDEPTVWRDIVKTDKGTLEFTKGFYTRALPGVTGSFESRPLDIVIEDGIVSIPSGVDDSTTGHGAILGNVVFDYVTGNTGNRNPTLKVTGNSELFWPVSFVNGNNNIRNFRNYVCADNTTKTTPNATYDIDKGVTLALGYNLAAGDIFYNNPLQMTGRETGSQEILKVGLGTLDLNYGAVGAVKMDGTLDDTLFIEKFTVKAGSIEAPYGTPFKAHSTSGVQQTSVEVFDGATFATGGGAHRTWDPDDAVTSVKSFWGKLGSTLDIKTGTFAIYNNQSTARNSIISGDVIGEGGLEAYDDGIDQTPTVVQIHGNNTYKGGTFIYPDAVVSFYKQNSLGTGPIVGEGGSVELATEGSKWIDLPNKIELAYQTGGLTFDVPAKKIVKQAAGVAYTDAVLTKIGAGELVLAGEGEASWRGNFNWISKGLSLAAVEGTVVLDHNKAAGHAGVSISDGAVVRAYNGFSGDNAFFLNDANATPTLDSAIGAVISSVTPALVTSESFHAEGDFAFQIYPKEPIKKGDTVAVLKAGKFDVDLAKFDATVTDVADKKFTTLAIAEGEGNTLELTAAKDIDVPTITATGLNVDAKANIAIVVKVDSTTPISKNVTVISDIPGERVSEVDVPGKTFTIYGVAPSTDTEIPVRVYVTTTGDWVTDTVDTDGITVYEDFVLKVGSGDEPPVPDKNTEDFAITGSGTNSEITVDVTVLLKGADAGTVIPNQAFELKLYHVGTSETDPLETSGTLTSDENGKYTYVFNSKAPYGYDAPYIIEAVGDGLEPVRSERITTAAKDTPITGGSSGGCDAGFGVFGLLAATGAVALLRKKD